jgi:hypothetical protein
MSGCGSNSFIFCCLQLVNAKPACQSELPLLNIQILKQSSPKGLKHNPETRLGQPASNSRGHQGETWEVQRQTSKQLVAQQAK